MVFIKPNSFNQSRDLPSKFPHEMITIYHKSFKHLGQVTKSLNWGDSLPVPLEYDHILPYIIHWINLLLTFIKGLICLKTQTTTSVHSDQHLNPQSIKYRCEYDRSKFLINFIAFENMWFVSRLLCEVKLYI